MKKIKRVITFSAVGCAIFIAILFYYQGKKITFVKPEEDTPLFYSCPAEDFCNSCHFDVQKIGFILIHSKQGCTEIGCGIKSFPEAESKREREACLQDWRKSKSITYRNVSLSQSICMNKFSKDKCLCLYADLNDFDKEELSIFAEVLKSGRFTNAKGHVNNKPVFYPDIQKKIWNSAVERGVFKKCGIPDMVSEN